MDPASSIHQRDIDGETGNDGGDDGGGEKNDQYIWMSESQH